MLLLAQNKCRTAHRLKADHTPAHHRSHTQHHMHRPCLHTPDTAQIERLYCIVEVRRQHRCLPFDRPEADVYPVGVDVLELSAWIEEVGCESRECVCEC